LSYISGLTKRTAADLVAWRDKNGAFKNRVELSKVPGIGAKVFQMAAGFLRIRGGDNPLDQSAVHPESYPLVERILEKNNTTLESVLGNSSFLRRIRPEDYVDETFGAPTIQDLLEELEKPGRDPRPEFRTATFKEGVTTLDDLKSGMVLEGTVTNVANFGAFVDIGVHQDGLVHISQLSDRFVDDPHAVVKTGQVVKVRVLEIDKIRNRVALSMKSKSPALK
jgi:protein Tex